MTTHARVFSRSIAGLLMLCHGMAMAEGCRTHLPGEPGSATSVTLVTLNRNGTASYVPMTKIEHLPALKVPSGGLNPAGGDDPEMYKTFNSASDPTPLYFSAGPTSSVTFDDHHHDVVALTLTVEDQPRVVLADVSRGYAKTQFRATCSASGVLHGSTPDADFLLLIQSAARG